MDVSPVRVGAPAPTLRSRAPVASGAKVGEQDALERTTPTSLPPLETPGRAVQTLLKSFGYAEFPQVSPDGKNLVFNVVHDYSTSQMFMMDADGHGPVRALDTGEKVDRTRLDSYLAERSGQISEQATWSEDGQTLYFRTNAQGTFGIGAYDCNHETSHVIFHDPKLNLKHPVEAEDGWLVCYGGPPDPKLPTVDQYSNLILAHPSTGESRALTSSRGEVAYKHPSMLDGMILAHKEPKTGEVRNSDLVKIDPQTLVETPITQTPDQDERHPFYNPRRDLLAYHRRKDGDKNLVISTPDGRRSAQLTFYGHPAQSPCWSPNGRSIYFVKKLDKPAEGQPFYLRQADLRKLDVEAALKDLKDQAKARLHNLERQGASEELLASAKQELDDYRFFLNRYRS